MRNAWRWDLACVVIQKDAERGLPKMLRPYFQRHRRRLKDLCALAHESSTESCRELANDSQLEVESDWEGVVPVEVVRAEGQKCERCWHWETDVGEDAKHPTLCGRCVEAVKQNSAAS